MKANQIHFEDADEVFDVEDIMSSITERWLLIEEVLEERTSGTVENRILRARNGIDGIDELFNQTKLSSIVDGNFERHISKLEVII